jgi:DNA-dependent metalloprotease WSS1
MLHELAHIVHGPHDANFHALWNQLRDEHEALLLKGYTGEGFLSDGRRLGGSAVLPLQEARRRARAEAEKRQQRAKLAKGSGRRLGGAAPGHGPGHLPDRNAMADAATRRAQTLRGCGNEGRDEGEMRAVEATATRNGFRTQADEDAANEAAIAQALWELGQEEERERYGGYYVHPSPDRPEGSSGRGAPMSQMPPPRPPHHTRPRPVSVLVSGPAPPLPTRPVSMSTVPTSRHSPYARPPAPPAPASAPALPPRRGWSCGVCTLHNPATFLCCEACGSEKGADVQKHLWTPNEDKRRAASRAV